MKCARGLLAVVLLLSPLSLDAQLPQNRSGFGISFGVGGGSGAVDCDGCASDRETGGSGYLRLGGYVRPNVLIGFEVNSYANTINGSDISWGFSSAVAQWYPNAATGFYLKGGAGLMGYHETDGVDNITVSALGLGLGLGYDARVGRNFSLTPYVNLLFSGKADRKFNSFSTGVDASFSLLQIGLGFSWH